MDAGRVHTIFNPVAECVRACPGASSELSRRVSDRSAVANACSLGWTVVMKWTATLVLFSLSLIAPVGLGEISPAFADDLPAKDSSADAPRPLILEDEPALLEPRRERTPAERDRLEAIVEFATGRMLERRQQEAEALRYYQRAYRLDPQAGDILEAIFPLAYRLNRREVAYRYALKLAELGEADALLLRRLGLHFAEQGKWAESVKLYEQVLAARQDEEETAAGIRLRMEMGHLYDLLGKHKKAAEQFAQARYALEHPDEFGIDERIKKVLLGDPGSTYCLMGECFLKAGLAGEAIEAFRQANQVAPHAGRLGFNMAQVYAYQKKWEAVLKALDDCFREKLDDEGAVPYELLAEALENLGQSDELLPRLERLRSQDATNVPLGYFLAGEYAKAKKYDKAEALYRTLFEGTPSLTAYRALIDIYRQTNQPKQMLTILGAAVTRLRSLQSLGEQIDEVAADEQLLDGIIAEAKQRAAAEPPQLDFAQAYSVALLAMEAKRFKVAGEFFELALKADPNETAEVLFVWGVGLLLAEGHEAEAAAVFQRAIDLPVDDDLAMFYYYYSWARAVEGKHDDALKAARQAVRLSELAAGNAAAEAKAAEVAREAAMVYVEQAEQKLKQTDQAELAAALDNVEKVRVAAQKATQEAQTAEREAEGKKEDWARHLSRVAWVLYHAGRNDEATKAYRELVKKFDDQYDSSEIRDVLRNARLILSNLCVLRNDFAPAEQWLEEVLDEFPDDVGASNDLGYLWADQNKHLHRALRMVQRAVEAEPESRAYRDSLGWVFFRLGRYKEAVAELEKAVEGDDQPDAVILDHLGDVYQAAGTNDEARQAWRRAVEAYRKQNETKKADATAKKIEQHQPSN